jgi:large subunit ribosomal protein L7/L12
MNKQEHIFMTSPKIQSIIDDITKLNLVETCELIKAIRTQFDLPDVVSGSAITTSEGPAAEEQAEFNVVLTSVGSKKIEVIKVIRQVTSLGLKEAKGFVDSVTDSTPYTIASDLDKEAAEALAANFAETGATVVLS